MYKIQKKWKGITKRYTNLIAQCSKTSKMVLAKITNFLVIWLPTSEVGGSNLGPYVGKLVVAYRWSAVYSTEP